MEVGCCGCGQHHERCTAQLADCVCVCVCVQGCPSSSSGSGGMPSPPHCSLWSCDALTATEVACPPSLAIPDARPSPSLRDALSPAGSSPLPCEGADRTLAHLSAARLGPRRFRNTHRSTDAVLALIVLHGRSVGVAHCDVLMLLDRSFRKARYCMLAQSCSRAGRGGATPKYSESAQRLLPRRPCGVLSTGRLAGFDQFSSSSVKLDPMLPC